MKELAAFLKDDERFDGKHGWDFGIYPEAGKDREQLVAMVGCCKAKDGDYRVLQPFGHPERPYHHYVIQCLSGQEELLEVPESTTPIVTRARRQPSTTTGKPSWLALPEGELITAALTAMTLKGMATGWVPGRMQNNLLPLKTVGERACCHGGVHTSNNSSVSFRRDGAILFHCTAEDHCDITPPIIGNWRKGLGGRMCLDALLPEQLCEFDPVLVKNFEAEVWAELPEAKKLRSCPSYGAYADFVTSYYNRFFVHVYTGKPEIVQFVVDEDGIPQKYERRTLAHTREITLNAGESFDIWVKSASKCTRKGFIAHPDPDYEDSENVNLCVGSFPMGRVAKEPLTDAELARIKPILRAFEVDICRDEPAHYDYVYNWLAYPLQKLGRKNNTAILIFGAQGTYLRG